MLTPTRLVSRDRENYAYNKQPRTPARTVSCCASCRAAAPQLVCATRARSHASDGTGCGASLSCWGIPRGCPMPLATTKTTTIHRSRTPRLGFSSANCAARLSQVRLIILRLHVGCSRHDTDADVPLLSACAWRTDGGSSRQVQEPSAEHARKHAEIESPPKPCNRKHARTDTHENTNLCAFHYCVVPIAPLCVVITAAAEPTVSQAGAFQIAQAPHSA